MRAAHRAHLRSVLASMGAAPISVQADDADRIVFTFGTSAPGAGLDARHEASRAAADIVSAFSSVSDLLTNLIDALDWRDQMMSKYVDLPHQKQMKTAEAWAKRAYRWESWLRPLRLGRRLSAPLMGRLRLGPLGRSLDRLGAALPDEVGEVWRLATDRCYIVRLPSAGFNAWICGVCERERPQKITAATLVTFRPDHPEVPAMIGLCADHEGRAAAVALRE